MEKVLEYFPNITLKTEQRIIPQRFVVLNKEIRKQLFLRGFENKSLSLRFSSTDLIFYRFDVGWPYIFQLESLKTIVCLRSRSSKWYAWGFLRQCLFNFFIGLTWVPDEFHRRFRIILWDVFTVCVIGLARRSATSLLASLRGARFLVVLLPQKTISPSSIRTLL